MLILYEALFKNYIRMSVGAHMSIHFRFIHKITTSALCCIIQNHVTTIFSTFLSKISRFLITGHQRKWIKCLHDKVSQKHDHCGTSTRMTWLSWDSLTSDLNANQPDWPSLKSSQSRQKCWFYLFCLQNRAHFLHAAATKIKKIFGAGRYRLLDFFVFDR